MEILFEIYLSELSIDFFGPKMSFSPLDALA